MNVQLLRYTLNPDTIAGVSAAICYDAKSPARALSSAMDGGHYSVLEHAVFTFAIDDVSRVLLAQLTRHRLASFSVQSQRYCGANKQCVIPETVLIHDYAREFSAMCDAAYRLYEEMVAAGIPEEDARYIIPQGTTCKLVMTMNARELRHFFSLRTCNRAQWEIRELADMLLRECKKVAPKLFEGAGCGCVNGHCPEGRRSCGKPRYESEWEDSDVPRED